jgi:hypothetical protein
MRVTWFLAALSVAGCVTPPPQEMGAAFGRVEYLEDGRQVSFGTEFLTSDGVRVLFRPAAGGGVTSAYVASDGSFYVPLPAGEHVFLGYRRGRKVGTRTTSTAGRVVGAFVVAKGEAVYIGDLRIEAVGRDSRWNIVDREGSTRERLAPRLTEAKLPSVKRLMRPEQPPGRYTRVTPICGGSWGIQCDSHHQGVTPVQPDGFPWTFPPVGSVTPLLEWTASSRREVTYDLAIYERLDIGVRGAVLAYAEGLQKPRYTPGPLQRGQRYEWSVRLRDGDTVSTWSTTNQTTVIVVPIPGLFMAGGGSSSGTYFGFEIPR